MGYVSIVSMYVGFLAWYRGLALGGIARVGQLQLAQPVLTLIWSWLLLGESIGLLEIAAGVVIVASVAFTRRYRYDVAIVDGRAVERSAELGSEAENIHPTRCPSTPAV